MQAAVTVIAFVLSSLVGLVHEATTRHVQCAEHGEQIHSDARPALGVVVRQLAVRDQPAAAIHGHEHCLMASATRASRMAPGAPAVAAAPGAVVAIAVAGSRAADGRGGAVYRTAPKTSPPA